MKHTYILYTALTIWLSTSVAAQPVFIQNGRITYERKTGQMTMLESIQDPGEDNMWVNELKKVMPRIVTDVYTLDFSPERTHYTLEKENAENKYAVMTLKPSASNYVLQDLVRRKTTMSRSVFENDYAVSDNMQTYPWKLTGETREIAGFECRKAITRICDSVVVVAFYTDEITVPGGPENFNGLPGMILGIAVPRLSLNLFATKLERSMPVISEKILKGKTVGRDQISKDMEKSMKEWGKTGQLMMWLAML